MATDPIAADPQTPLERVPTGIPGLDTVLRGGFLRAGIYIVRGEPGAGKTILGNQFCFNHVAAPGTVRSTSPFWRKRTTA
jgi:circadian clock protein KaiC